MMEPKRFFIFGSGNVASHLAPAIVQSGWTCAGVYSRTKEHADILADKLHCDANDDLGETLQMISQDQRLDIVIISLTDNALSEVASLLSSNITATVLHTSGSTPMSVLSRVSSYGVLYPMQTFSKERVVDISATPFFIEAHDEVARRRLQLLTDDLRITRLQEISSDERIRLHMAAVFGCNFVNHLYAMASEVLDGTGIPFDILTPLLEETLQKALSHPPATVQTGPAVRHDQVTIDRHLSALRDNIKLSDVYRFLTESIQSYHPSNS